MNIQSLKIEFVNEINIAREQVEKGMMTDWEDVYGQLSKKLF